MTTIAPGTPLLCIRTPANQDQVRSGGIYVCEHVVLPDVVDCDNCGGKETANSLKLKGIRQTLWFRGELWRRVFCPCCFTPLDGGLLSEEEKQAEAAEARPALTADARPKF